MRKQAPNKIRLTSSAPFRSGKKEIVLESDWPKDAKDRKPFCIYLPDIPVSERDEALGRFLASWNSVELAIQYFLSHCFNRNLSYGPMIFDLGFNSKQLSELIIAVSHKVLRMTDVPKVERWIKRYTALNTKRNRIVHGAWVYYVFAEFDDTGSVQLTDQYWRRSYTPSDIEEAKKLKRRDKSVSNKYLFSIEQIINLSKDAEKLFDDAETILALYPEQHQKP